MAGPKAATPPPIDKPVAKAYLREFVGWSTAYPPGTSEPSSLRVMHNVNVDTDGSLRIRPGMKHALNVPAPGDIVGTFEHFYTTDGRKAILFAYRDVGDGNKVKFCTAVYNPTTHVFDLDAALTTHFPGAVSATLAFNSSCTYVKYVQIDNRILALSDSGEPFRVFWVGANPKAKKISKITVPDYTLAQAPSVIQPDDAWVAGPILRTNKFNNPRGVSTAGLATRFSWPTDVNQVAAGGPVTGVNTHAQVRCHSAEAASGRGFCLYESTDRAAPTGVPGYNITSKNVGDTLTLSVWVRSSKAGTFQMSARGFTGTTWQGAAVTSTGVAIAANTWTRFSVTYTVASGATDLCATVQSTTSIAWAVGDTIRFTGIMIEETGTLQQYFDGGTVNGIANRTSRWLGAENQSQSVLVDPSVLQTTVPGPEIPAANTLISSDSSKNTYSFGYFYSFNNEIGETPASRITVVKGQRRWTGWRADAADDKMSSDQLAVIIPQAVYDAAVAQGALSWNLYFVTWSDQDSVPVEAVLLRTVGMEGKTYAEAGWATHTPLLQALDGLHALPNPNDTDNFSDPSTAGQGLVAGDRLVLVYDRLQAARIRWSSNRQGDYLNFSASKGGGFKTLTSGNLFIPACVKLWQNPQSVDTITVLCMGLDGYGTAYYMNPNTSVSTQSQAQSIMGFEETTATPGTVSPYGCEVLNNALYHPLDNNLMKSTASNYNINHITIADSIQNVWHQVKLADKRRMVSSQMDMSLYYLIRSPLAWSTDTTSNGNQVWICATGQSNVWSVWDVAGTSLRKLEIDGLLYMSITSGRNIFIFDPEQDHDDVWDGAAWREAGIAWQAVTNTQGANRAHDIWATLQQANVMFGNFTGECVYGIRGKDVNGKMIEVKKHYVAPQRGHAPLDRYDQEDMLLIRRILKEWEFFWQSADRPKNRSYGSIAHVQYRTVPATMNVGVEFGSIETFEYGSRAPEHNNGVPTPYADTQKP